MKRLSHWARAPLLAGMVLLLIMPLAALASDVDIAVVDVVAPTGSVTLAPGQSGPIKITATVTGNQEGTATFDVYRDWTLSGGVFAGSNPERFTVDPREARDPATTFVITGTVTVAAGQAPGTFTLAVGAFDITNSNQTGAKLSAGRSSNYQVTVSAPADTTPPVITPTITGTLGQNGWYTSDVTVSWSVSDPESAVTSPPCAATTINYDTTGLTVSCSATSAGGTSAASVTIKRDATPPTIAWGAPDPAPNDAGWNNGNVSIAFTPGDATSGVASTDPASPLELTAEGSEVTGSVTVTDNAGNSATYTSTKVKIDKTPPTFGDCPISGDISLGSILTVSITASDSLSGLDNEASTLTAKVDTGSVGTKSVKFTAVDKAGNEATKECSYRVIFKWSGFFRPVDNPPVVNRVKAGSAVPIKFSLAGDQGLDIFASGYPASFAITTDWGAPIDDIPLTETVFAGNSGLTYDPLADQYVYVWKTDKSWAGTSREFVIRLIDGTYHRAYFTFTK